MTERNPFRRTYRIEDGPRHVSYEDYINTCHRTYEKLLSGNPTEPMMQDFLERHPFMVPGHDRGHMPLHVALVSQPELPGVKRLIPDFMWIATNSMEWYPTMIEIENPKKQIFIKNGDTGRDFNHARNQLAQWRAWFEENGNLQKFIRDYGIPERIKKRALRVRTILVYGRRSEFENDDRRTKQLASLCAEGEEIMTYDRLRVARDMMQAITVRASGEGRYRAKWIPSVFETGPDFADRLLSIDEIPEAMRKNPELDGDRRSFLSRRVEYWKDWAARHREGYVTYGERE